MSAHLFLVSNESEATVLRQVAEVDALSIESVEAISRLDMTRVASRSRVILMMPESPEGKMLTGVIKRRLVALKKVGWKGKAGFLYLPAGTAEFARCFESERGSPASILATLVKQAQNLRTFRETGLIASEVRAEKVEWLIEGYTA